MVYSGKPPAWPNPGAPVAWSGDFQLPARGNERVVTIELNPASLPLDLAGFEKSWRDSGPADLKALRRVSTTAERGVYDLDLLYTDTNRARRIQARYEHGSPGAEGHSHFDYWLLIDETLLP